MPNVRHLEVFPFCEPTQYPPKTYLGEVIPTGYGSGSGYQFQLPLELCTRMWWTVRHWKIFFDISYYRDLSVEPSSDAAVGSYNRFSTQNINLSTTTTTTSSGDYALDYRLYDEPQNESFLVCRDDNQVAKIFFAWKRFVTVEYYIIKASDPTDIDSGTFLSTIDTFFSTGGIPDGGLLNPIYVRDASKNPINPQDPIPPLERDEPIWVNLDFAVGVGEAIPTSQSNPNAQGEFKMEGLSSGWPNPKDISQTRTFGVNTGNTNSITITINNLVIEPEEYWPYDPEDGGGPIYDTATGEQIRNYG